MITMEPIKAETNAIRIIIPKTPDADDFSQLTPKIDQFIREHGKIRILVNASHFNGWKNMEAFDKHMGFVKTHQQRVERIALIAGHLWQHWMVGMFKIFVHPEVKIFEQNEAGAAEQWLME